MVQIAYLYRAIPLPESVEVQDALRLVVDAVYAPSSVTTGVDGGVLSTVIPSDVPMGPQRCAPFSLSRRSNKLLHLSAKRLPSPTKQTWGA